MPSPEIPSRLRAGYQYAAKQPQFRRYSTVTLQYAEAAYSKIASLEQDLYYLGMSYYVRDLLLERMGAA